MNRKYRIAKSMVRMSQFLNDAVTMKLGSPSIYVYTRKFTWN